MDFLTHIVAGLLEPVFGLVHPVAPLNVYSLAGAAAVAVGVYVWTRSRRKKSGDGAGLGRTLLPPDVYLHSSATLDYRWYFVNGALGAIALAFLIASSDVWRDLTVGGLDALFGPGAASTDAAAPGWGVSLLTAVLIVVTFDLGYWVSHWLLHRVPALWEFHKVHHSAEVLTPATTWRQHPVEEVLVANLIAATTGATYGAMAWLFGPGAHALSLFQVNVVLFAYFMTFFHLRHSHVWLPLTGLAGRIVQSPAHHQIHHSEDPRHHNRNLGFCLSIWDWAFGTLWVPERHEALTFGLGAESKEFNSIGRLYALPFQRIARRLAAGLVKSRREPI